MTEHVWTLEQAITFIQVWAPEARKMGLFLGLVGGVLERGWSNKDLDITVHALGDPRPVTDLELETLGKRCHCVVLNKNSPSGKDESPMSFGIITALENNREKRVDWLGATCERVLYDSAVDPLVNAK